MRWTSGEDFVLKPFVLLLTVDNVLLFFMSDTGICRTTLDTKWIKDRAHKLSPEKKPGTRAGRAPQDLPKTRAGGCLGGASLITRHMYLPAHGLEMRHRHLRLISNNNPTAHMQGSSCITSCCVLHTTRQAYSVSAPPHALSNNPCAGAIVYSCTARPRQPHTSLVETIP